MGTTDSLRLGRESFERREWAAAVAHLSAADAGSPLAPDDLDRLATATYLTGGDAHGAWTRAHHELLQRGDVERAARCAFWLAFDLLNRGEMARGGGWAARAQQLLDRRADASVEHGYVLLTSAFRCIVEGDWAGASAMYAEAAAIGEAFGDPDLIALARHGKGRALIRIGDVAGGIALLDDAMVAVDAGEVSPMVVGDVYCGVISGCMEVFDVRRAHEWTTALTRWCASQPDLVAYSGECLVRRAELMVLHGAWPDAGDAARLACERLALTPGRLSTGAAFYQQAELHRLRGDFAGAEEAYRQASRCGRSPEPGLSLLRLAQGRLDAAQRGIRRALDEAAARRTRSRMLPAYIEIVLAAHDVDAARAAAGELAEIAADLGAPFLRAASAQALGAVLLAEGDGRAAVAALREAWACWQELDAPYESARTRVLIGLAGRALGDEDGARMELDAASSEFRRLGATPDLARVDALVRTTSRGSDPLTARERQVLHLVAAGMTNRGIAAELEISEKTVARHVSNIFTKLGLSSRAAATAYAYQRGLA